MQTTLRDLVFARLSAGKSRLASTPIIAMTTINSISVKPGRQAGVAQISNLCTPKAFGAGRTASSLRDLRIIQRAGGFAGQPIGNRRHGRLEICATRFRTGAGLAAFRLLDHFLLFAASSSIFLTYLAG